MGTETTSVAAVRGQFNSGRAVALANQLGLPPRLTGGRFSSRFAFFGDDETLAIVAGAQEDDGVELALAYAVRWAEGRRTVLVLPDGNHNATAQRIPWLRGQSQPELYLHRTDGSTVECQPRSRDATAQALLDRLNGLSPEKELEAAIEPLHLRARAAGVVDLTEALTRDRRLDHAHRQKERSWHYAGQRVLSIRQVRGGLAVTAGIHYSGANASAPIVLMNSDALSEAQTQVLLDAVEVAIVHRRNGAAPIHRPDESWLQAVIRRDPAIAGVEQPALRELPAWRPGDSPRAWGRGYIDLAGLDGNGNVRIVETKLATNADDLLVLQGLDYLVWATAYRGPLLRRLGANRRATLELHYVLGADAQTGKHKISPCTPALAAALDPSVVVWRFQTIGGSWFQPPENPGALDVALLPAGQVPEP